MLNVEIDMGPDLELDNYLQQKTLSEMASVHLKEGHLFISLHPVFKWTPFLFSESDFHLIYSNKKTSD